MKLISMVISAVIALLAVSLFAVQVDAANPIARVSASHHQQIAFTQNMGQWPDSILFRASAGSTIMWLVKDGIYYQFTRVVNSPHSREGVNPDLNTFQQPDSVQTAIVKVQFVGANPAAQVVGLEEQEGKSNYFLGNDPTTWRTDVPGFSGVTFKQMYPGVDVTFRSDANAMAYAASGTREALEQIKIRYNDVTSEPSQPLIVPTKLGEKTFQGALLISENSSVATSTVSSAGGVTTAYSTYLGGSNYDQAEAVAVDSAGSAYVAGYTLSTDFPTQTPYQTDPSTSSYDIFITKMSAEGSSLVYSTYLGGAADDRSFAMAIDDSGSVYLTGYTASNNFPTLNPYQSFQAGKDVFVTKLSPAGSSLLYSTYLGGSNNEEAWDIAIDAHHNAYVTGHTASANFPTQSPYRTDQTGEDAFVTKLSSTGSSLVYGTYLGGNAADYGYCIAVDSSDCAYVGGKTASTDFPTVSSYQSYQGAATFSDAFVTKFSAAGTSLSYSTYLGGDKNDEADAIVVDEQGCAYVAGSTISANFPTLSPYQTYKGAAGLSDGFVTKLSTAGNSTVYSTYLGGTNNDACADIALDSSGSAYVTGITASTNFQVLNQFQADQGLQDAFVTKLRPAGNSAIYSTYLGGSSNDWGEAIDVDPQGNAYVTGYTLSTNFPTFTAYQPDQGTTDAYVTKLAFAPCCTGITGNVNQLGIIDLTDLSYLIGYLTLVPAPALPCPDEANINALGIVDLTDLSYLITYLTVVPQITLPNCP